MRRSVAPVLPAVPYEPAAVAAALAAAVPSLGAVTVVPRTGSTSADLVAAARGPEPPPDRAVRVADHQAAGRGRAGRTWETPPGQAVTVSVLLRPGVPVGAFGWLPLLGGLAVVRAVAGLGVEAVLKWPNDVLVPGAGDAELAGWGTARKVAGVLGDLVADAEPPAAVVGIGVNVGQPADALPVPSATSLAALGVAADRVDVLVRVVRELVALDDAWRAARGDAVAAGLAAECAAVCATLGSRVRVLRPGGDVLEGVAVSLAADGALRVADDAGAVRTVLAGDVEHVRV